VVHLNYYKSGSPWEHVLADQIQKRDPKSGWAAGSGKAQPHIAVGLEWREALGMTVCF
jgi:hypothetical protein